VFKPNPSTGIQLFEVREVRGNLADCQSVESRSFVVVFGNPVRQLCARILAGATFRLDSKHAG
jgi:hypothetical protein